MKSSDLVEVAKVVSAHGIAGLLKVRPYAGSQTVLTQCRSVQLRLKNTTEQAPATVFNVSLFRLQGDFCLMGLEGCSNRDQAELLKGAAIFVTRADFPSLQEGEYYWADLLACQVMNQDGVDFGQVLSVESFGAHPLLKVSLPGQRYRLIPFVAKHVEHVDTDGKRIVVDWHVDDYAD